MVREEKKYVAEAKVLQKIVKSRLFDEETWPANQDVTDTMINVLKSMGFLKTVDDVAASDYGAVLATPMSDALHIWHLMNLAGIDIHQGCMFDEIMMCREVTELDENILVSSDGTPYFWHHLRHIAMRLYYDYYNIAPGSDEDPLKTHIKAGKLMAARGP